MLQPEALSWLNSEILAHVQTPGVPRLYRIGKTTLFVTCGTGYSFVPVRFGTPNKSPVNS